MQSPERTRWQAVVYQAFADATFQTPMTQHARLARRVADWWIRSNGRDFRDVCANAGMDPDFLSEAYTQGRFDRALMKSAEKKSQP